MSNKIKCSHILVDKQSEALQLLDEIKKGKKFGAVAKAISKCPSRKKDGSLKKGWTQSKIMKMAQKATTKRMK